MRVSVQHFRAAHGVALKRGRRQKPVEFGHIVLSCQTREKFITDFGSSITTAPSPRKTFPKMPFPQPELSQNF